MSLTISLLLPCPVCLDHLLGWIVRWEVSGHKSCFDRCHFQDLLKTVFSTVLSFPFSFVYMHYVSVQKVHPYSNIDTVTLLKKIPSYSDKSDFWRVDNLSISVHILSTCMLKLLSAYELLLPMYMNVLVYFTCLISKMKKTTVILNP